MGNTSSSKVTKKGDRKEEAKAIESSKPNNKITTTTTNTTKSTETLHSKLSVTDHTGDTTRNVFDYYEKVKVIGEGSTCKIFAVRRKRSSSFQEDEDDNDEDQQSLLALKEISKDQVDGTFLEELRNEVAILRTLDHPNIVKVYEMFESKRAIYLIMEYCYGGDLYGRVPYTEAQVAKIMTKLLSAVAYIHKKNIVHRDIKMENIMLESDKPDAKAKLIDFGLSQSYCISSSSSNNKSKMTHLSELVGTAYCMSPQVIRKQYTSKADLWACGVVAFILLSNKWPFEGSANKEITSKILKNDWNKDFEGEEWKHISSEAKAFVRHLMAYDEDKRWDAGQALRSKWLTKAFPSDEGPPEQKVLNSVTNALIQNANDGKMKKLAMQVIAYNSSTNDIEKLRHVFDQFDANHKGTINYWEFRTSLNQCKYKDADIKKIFKNLDVNGTGVINYTEFIAATLETLGKIEDERIRAAFDKLDEDNTGHISKENLCTVLGEKCTASDCDNLVNELMEEVDIDGDGTITYDEFLNLFRERHRQANQNACCSPMKSKEEEKSNGCGGKTCGGSS
ncbi:unnamed protein product [Cylindrotheca closterium]|uniref:Calmodulin n=1 Tax=Cylindrotheca closterium TaxID=2856 RepID=A0AAD2FEC7_9STRA|nr:unnamed protein product [Cylindrotheca closterium]